MNPDTPSTVGPALAAAVVAWHNRHPFAQRISAGQVGGFGVVALPFTAPGAPPLGKVVLAPAVQRPHGGEPASAPTPPMPSRGRGATTPDGLQGAFSEGLIDELPPGAIADFARRHGSSTRPGPADWPQRDLPMAPGATRTLPVVRFVYSAAIEVGGQRRRVLIGTGSAPTVLGQRLTSRRRLAAVGAGLLGLVLAVGLVGSQWLQAGAGETPPAAPPDAALAAAAPPAASSTEAPAALLSGPPARSSPDNPPSALAPPAQASAPAPDALAPTPAAAAQGSIRPGLSDDERDAARRASAALRQARAPASAPAGALASAPSSLPRLPPTAASAAAPAPAADVVYAVVTPETRTRAGSQLRIVLMNAPTTRVMGQPHAEVMQVGQGFRAVLWPFTTRAEAEEAQAALAARGIPSQVVEL